MLNQISSSCGIHIEELSDRIIRSARGNGISNGRADAAAGVDSTYQFYGPSIASVIADIGSFAAFVIILVWFGWWFVRQWKSTMDTAVASFMPRAPESVVHIAQQIPETRIEIVSERNNCNEKKVTFFD
ncbi:hypothetical protein IW140_005615 [Coemansia sp. RSA 1813]|nr:hypothetical protein LPJ74_005737 [Coemansia sp. RSA 1843]KAJ2086468.1 hypothetical protein IW138_005668 [Coemansia sp. RSA 986]KAJ2215028.1 hypothetical protein EV179_002558 [Coemansia sp. RSA 487]KAJ2564776.1 hypothetical protein IW140_005615 [Coemansia sp. RSA 1813]